MRNVIQLLALFVTLNSSLAFGQSAAVSPSDQSDESFQSSYAECISSITHIFNKSRDTYEQIHLGQNYFQIDTDKGLKIYSKSGVTLVSDHKCGFVDKDPKNPETIDDGVIEALRRTIPTKDELKKNILEDQGRADAAKLKMQETSIVNALRPCEKITGKVHEKIEAIRRDYIPSTQDAVPRLNHPADATL